MRTGDAISRESRRSAERIEQLDADRTRLSEQLNELDIAERVLTRFGREATKEKIEGEGAKDVSMAQ